MKRIKPYYRLSPKEKLNRNIWSTIVGVPLVFIISFFDGFAIHNVLIFLAVLPVFAFFIGTSWRKVKKEENSSLKE